MDLNPALAQTEQTCVPSAGKTVLIRCVSDKRVVNALLEHEKTQTGWDNRVVVQPLGGTGCAYWTIVEKDGWLQFWNSGGRLSGPLGKGSHSADVQRTRSSYTVTPVEGSKGYVLQRLALDGVTLVALVALEDENGLTRLCEIGKKPSNGTVVEFVEVRK